MGIQYESLESGFVLDRTAYSRSIWRTLYSLKPGRAPDWEPWILQFLKTLALGATLLRGRIASLTAAARPAEAAPSRNSQGDPAFGELPELSARILEQLKSHDRVGMGEMVELTGASRNTLKTHFRRLAAQGRISKRGGGRGVWYTRP